MAIKDGLTASQRLPWEVVLPICVMAAETDYRCANAMAFVNKEICLRTANARWKTVVLTSMRQLFAFFKIVHAVPDELYDRCMLDWSTFEPTLRPKNLDYTPRSMKQLASAFPNKRSLRRTEGISLPQEGEPQDHVRHLFIDMGSGSDLDPHDCSALDDLFTVIAGKGSRGLSPDIMDIWGKVFSPFPLSNEESRQQDETKFHLQHLSLGPGLYEFLKRFRRFFQYEELTIIYHRLERLDYYEPGETFAQEINEVLKESILLQVLNCTVTKRLHLIDENLTKGGPAVPPPWKLLEFLNKHAGKLTHLRYDAVESTFDHPSFVDSLRPLLEEATISKENLAVLDTSTSHSAIRPVQRMARGDTTIGRFVGYLQDELRVGHFEYMQFAWKAQRRQAHIEASIRLGKKRRRFASSAGAEGSHYSRASKDSTLATKIREEITAHYGWDAPGIQSASDFCVRKYSLPLQEREGLDNHAFSPDECVQDYERIKRGYDEKAQNVLRRAIYRLKASGVGNGVTLDPLLENGIRAPKSLLELGDGGRKVVFSRQDRIALLQERANGGRGAWPA